jgi:hypothetical protein
MALSRSIRWISLGVALTALALSGWFLLPDRDGRPYCHKQISLGFRLWMDDRQTNAFPNINGSSGNSLYAIREEMAGTNWCQHYKYIPGLREGDPGDLVLLYLDRPTRWSWHGQIPPTIFGKKAWILVPLDFKEGDRDRKAMGPGEESERVSVAEFAQRLEHTLDFLRTNERPNWKIVLAEHTPVLDSIKHRER